MLPEKFQLVSNLKTGSYRSHFRGKSLIQEKYGSSLLSSLDQSQTFKSNLNMHNKVAKEQLHFYLILPIWIDVTSFSSISYYSNLRLISNM